MNSINTFVA